MPWQVEAEADELAKQAERLIAAETVAASALDGDDGVVEAFAAWLPGARQRAAQAREACERAQADVSRARAVLSMTRAGVEAVATLAQEQAARLAALAARREQHALDDAARPRGARRRRHSRHDPAPHLVAGPPDVVLCAGFVGTG